MHSFGQTFLPSSAKFLSAEFLSAGHHRPYFRRPDTIGRIFVGQTPDTIGRIFVGRTPSAEFSSAGQHRTFSPSAGHLTFVGRIFVGPFSSAGHFRLRPDIFAFGRTYYIRRPKFCRPSFVGRTSSARFLRPDIISGPFSSAGHHRRPVFVGRHAHIVVTPTSSSRPHCRHAHIVVTPTWRCPRVVRCDVIIIAVQSSLIFRRPRGKHSQLSSSSCLISAAQTMWC